MGSTGKERDSETGLDYFGARYMSAAQGRFKSPDAPFADQHSDDPQSWNLYAYGRNNPLKFVDPTGESVTVCPGTDPRDCKAYTDDEYKRMVEEERTVNGASLPNLVPISSDEALHARLICDGRPCGTVMWANDHIPDGVDPLLLVPAATGAIPLLGAVSFKGLLKDLAELWADETGSMFIGGGGRTGRKINEKRLESAQEAVGWLDRILSRLKSKANKTPADKQAIKIVEGRLEDAKERMRKSEPHAREAQGPRR